MKRRPRRVVPAVAVALALLVLCVLVAVSTIQKISGTKELVSYHSVTTRLHDTTWGSGWVLGVGIAAVVVGLLLLAVALWPGRAVVVPLASEDGVDAGIARRSLRAALEDATDAVDGLEAARVRLGRKKVRVKARTHRTASDIDATTRAAIDRRLALVGPREPHTVTTRVRRLETGGAR
ncbi:DUF6286 domain-containing protein [Nocardia blacklockiae]|uniref:DUF6286 domain-containing protein n=1 Tax=Nocardia blacklockiae TaxID=480036 RepID=UPI0018942B94|nr:DUF6286 domain-containing protein [Nocardia blacklockiae]MBF6174867.1 hypothetical protein [Nocardia blacklockiae]